MAWGWWEKAWVAQGPSSESNWLMNHLVTWIGVFFKSCPFQKKTDGKKKDLFIHPNNKKWSKHQQLILMGGVFPDIGGGLWHQYLSKTSWVASCYDTLGHFCNGKANSIPRNTVASEVATLPGGFSPPFRRISLLKIGNPFPPKKNPGILSKNRKKMTKNNWSQKKIISPSSVHSINLPTKNSPKHGVSSHHLGFFPQIGVLSSKTGQLGP